jgi:hypothetical protein
MSLDPNMIMMIASAVGGQGGEGGQGDSGGGLGQVLGKASGSLHNATGAATSMTVGAVQLVSGLIARKKADRLIPGREDPELNQLETNIRRRARAFETGTAMSRQRAEVLSSANVGGRMVFSGGRGLKSGLNYLSIQTNKGIMALNNQALAMQNSLYQQEAEVTKERVQRRLDISMYRHLAKKAIAENRIKSGSANLMSGLAQSNNIANTGNTQDLQGSSGLSPEMQEYRSTVETDPNQQGSAVLTEDVPGQGPEVVGATNMTGNYNWPG